MNKFGYYILASIIGILVCMPAMAQRQQFGGARNREASSSEAQSKAKEQKKAAAAARSRVQYRQNYMKQVGDSLIIDMDIDMSKMGLKTNHAQILTPVVGSSSEEIELPKVMIQGTTRNKAFVRELELDDQSYNDFENNLPYAIVKPKGQLNYRMSIPYESWMSDAYLDVEEDLCGCGDKSKIARTRVYDGLTKDIVAEPLYKVKPQLAYIQPEVETIKKRREIENAYLDFPRGKSEILPNFGNNPTELAKIDKMIRAISSNADATVTSVEMTGYASPESSEKFNTELSRARAESLMRYFSNNSSVAPSLFDTRTGGEDWEGFRKLLEDYPLSNKREIFRLMTSIDDLDAREKAISKVDGGRPYKIIYEEIYPKLRRVVCEVNYTVKDFSMEEAKRNIETDPQLLSLNEMYIVANTYEAGSPEFLRVFEVAREEFPDDPVANLNGAAAALAKNDLRNVQRYLQMSDPSTPEYANNMGVYQMLKGNYAEADKFLKHAQSVGLPQATANLRELSKKMANVKNRREANGQNGGNAARSASSSSQRRRAN